MLLPMLLLPGGVAIVVSVAPSMTQSKSANWLGSLKGSAADE